ncbi:uncharacterized protein LOC123219121 [Mangifera indica]|uniref:uncharacterized protein LOC123219068 n=1 Tax=Mangifera indica TaxID=29780 RepID=UPI001CF93AC8|nr:uncharacterized protein LOC123219068 [Mangifera indica]XP_044496810.1 uncharacterized protein LOC123219121 [Mangifera indica]
MRFLLELVSCCGSPEAEGASPVAKLVEPRDEETRSLMRRSYQRKRRGRSGGSSTEEWRPSLCSISEDFVMDRTKSERERSCKRKNGGSLRDKARFRSCSRDFGQNSGPSIIPAFSATPFMF